MMELTERVENVLELSLTQKNGLEKLHVNTVRDLLWHFPARYEDFSRFKTISNVTPKEHITVEGKITHIDLRKTWKSKVAIAEGTFADATGTLKLIWFHQPYIARFLKDGDLIRIRGEIQSGKRGLYIANPFFEKIDRLSISLNIKERGLIPVYPETRGISSRWLHFHITKLLQSASLNFKDILPKAILTTYHLPSLIHSLRAIHTPRNEREAEGARKRFAFEEIFLLQLSRIKERKLLEKKKSFILKTDEEALKEFLEKPPFTLTASQRIVLEDLKNDIATPTPMARLLEGDVGSGKTILAAIISFIAVKNDAQVAYMAPTEILASQHFNAFSELFKGLRIKIGLITSSDTRVFPSKAFPKTSAHVSRTQLLRWAKSGEIKILIGTHALIEKKVQFNNLALIVVDEQHRFGVQQRARLARTKMQTENPLPHFLSMTATPIPRTLALTVYGDLDLSVLDEMPPGRSPTETMILMGRTRKKAWDTMREEINKGHQAFVICPRIEHDDDRIKSVKKEAERLKKEIFPDFTIGVLHGKLTPKEKETTMEKYKKGEIQILVSTSVIEVGIDIPNATVMVVEGAERFGLAQLHQMRGRIGRGKHKSIFFVISDSQGEKTKDRLHALRNARSGFELAEYDLQLRGAGELTGSSQWGISDVGMEALKNIKMVEAARKEARNIIEKDPELSQSPLLKGEIEIINKKLLHFE